MRLMHNMTMTELEGLKVKVYRNLTRRCFSVKAAEGRCKGKVVAHLEQDDLASLERVTFEVNQKGRQWVLANNHKLVHAFVVGHYHSLDAAPDLKNTVVYNPKAYDSFVTRDTEQPIYQANKVALVSNLVAIMN